MRVIRQWTKINFESYILYQYFSIAKWEFGHFFNPIKISKQLKNAPSVDSLFYWTIFDIQIQFF